MAPVTDGVGTLAHTLDTGDNSASGSPLETITSNVFSATAGDDLLVALATNVGDVTLDSGTWGTSSITVDNLVLTPVPSSVSDWMILED